MRRYVGLWWRMLRLCFVAQPLVTVGALTCRLLSLAIAPAIGLSLAAAVNASAAGMMRAALIGAVAAAAAQSLHLTVEYLGSNLKLRVVDRTGLLVLEPEIMRGVSEIEGIDHLERSDFADRVSVLRGASWGLVASAWSAVDTVAAVVCVATSLALLGTVSPILLLLLPFAVVPVWFDTRGRRLLTWIETATEENIRLERHLFELATGAASGKEIRMAGAAPELIRRQAASYHAAYNARFRAQLVNAAWRAGGWTLFTLGFAGALAIVIERAASGVGSIGDLVLAITIAATLRNLVQQTVVRSTETARASVLIEPYLWLRGYVAQERAQHAEGRAAPQTLRDGIRLEGVSYRYPGTDRDAVQDVTVHLPAGSVVAVVGEYGCGKSTLVKLLCKFHVPSAGRILVDGTDLTDLDASSWREHTAVAFQDFGRYQMRFGEAVGLGDLDHIDDENRVRMAVAAADGQDLVRRLPQGLTTPLGREFGGLELSEGQWQKLALARACMRPDPLLFVLDEPTASLDAPSELAIFDRYIQRARGLAGHVGAITVIISHRFSTVTDADLILVMEDGRLVEAGSHDSLVEAGGVYAELYGISSRAYAVGTPPSEVDG